MPRAVKATKAAKKPVGKAAASTSATPAAGAKAGAKVAAKRATGTGRTTAKRAAAKSHSPVPKKAAHDRAKKVASGTRAKKAGGARAKGQSPDKFLLEQRRALDAERAEYVAQAEALKAEADQMAQEAEPGDVQFDDESGEGGTVNIDRERDLALSAQARAAVEDIDHALAKIDNRTYGDCEGCGQPIPKARLKALPQARLCVACKSGGLSRR